MYVEKQRRALEYVSRLKDDTYMVQGDEGIIYIKLGWYQDIFICRDGTIEGKSYHIDWNDPCEFEEYAHSITLMKNLLFFIENGHNEGTT